MTTILQTLTDFEEAGLRSPYCLADGHAYQDLHPAFHKIIKALPQIWEDCSNIAIPDAEQLFNKNFSVFINAPVLESFNKNFRICPTASNSIDLVGATLNYLKKNLVMIEPAFDNLALLLKRRGVNINSVNDSALFQAAELDEIDTLFPDLKKFDALALIHPNNPTGLTLSEFAFKNIVKFCKENNMILVIDNCFRAFRKNNYCDYTILVESLVSFMALEDTGKVWPTQDLKASLIYFSNDLKDVFCELYNEVYLCVSNFALGIISAFYSETTQVGLQKTIWDIVAVRRSVLREIIAGSDLSISNVSLDSDLPVEWLAYSGKDKDDYAICRELKELNLAVLPGRQFYWNSSQHPSNHKNIRISLMKKETIFSSGMVILEQYCQKLSKNWHQELNLSIAG